MYVSTVTGLETHKMLQGPTEAIYSHDRGGLHRGGDAKVLKDE